MTSLDNLRASAWSARFKVWCLRMARRGRPLDLASLDEVVILSPHPDDEVIGCGMLLAELVRLGKRPKVISVTDGAASHPEHPLLSAADLRSIRHEEAIAGLAVLGVPAEDYFELGVPDGSMQALSKTAHHRAVVDLSRLLERLAPTDIFIPYVKDGTLDHEAVHRLGMTVISQLKEAPAVYEFPIWAKWIHRHRDALLNTADEIKLLELPGLREMKARALECHASQINPTPPWKEAVVKRQFFDAAVHSPEFFLRSRSRSTG